MMQLLLDGPLKSYLLNLRDMRRKKVKTSIEAQKSLHSLNNSTICMTRDMALAEEKKPHQSVRCQPYFEKVETSGATCISH